MPSRDRISAYRVHKVVRCTVRAPDHGERVLNRTRSEQYNLTTNLGTYTMKMEWMLYNFVQYHFTKDVSKNSGDRPMRREHQEC
jgi:hypothetical protein